MRLSSKVLIAYFVVSFFSVFAIVISLKYFPGSPFSIALSNYLLLGYIFLMFIASLFFVFMRVENVAGMIISIILLLIGEIYLIHIANNMFYDIFLLIPVFMLILGTIANRLTSNGS